MNIPALKNNYLEKHKAKISALLDIKYALTDGLTHIKINDYEFDCHLSINFANGVQVNIMIDDEFENIYFTTLLLQNPQTPDFNLPIHYIRIVSALGRDDESWQLYSTIDYKKKVDVNSANYEIRWIKRLAEELVNDYPDELSPGHLDEDNFEFFIGLAGDKEM